MTQVTFFMFDNISFEIKNMNPQIIKQLPDMLSKGNINTFQTDDGRKFIIPFKLVIAIILTEKEKK